MNVDPSNLTTGLKAGDKLDKFEIMGQIGAGGSSIVWKGYDRLLDRAVAIKQLALNGATGEDEDQVRARFRQEVATQKKISGGHKNIAKVIEFIEDPRGMFIVMEFIEGASLEQVIAQNKGPMDQKQVLGIVGATAMALEAIHAQGVVHRDLKPSNILLPKAGGLKVVDFGVAGNVGDQEAMSIGSVRYMAPELFQEGRVDGRADIYSLGMIAYEMLAGREAFNEAFRVVIRDQRNQAMRWMKWHTNQRVTAPPLNTINPKVPKKLSDLVARMMEKDPDARIASAEELLGAIRRHFAPGGPGGGASSETRERAEALAADDVDASAMSAPAERTAPLPKKSRLPLILAITMGVLLLVFATMVIGFKIHDNAALNQRRLVAIKDFRDADGVLRVAEASINKARESSKPEEADAALKDAAEKATAARKTFQQLAVDWKGDAFQVDPAAFALFADGLVARANKDFDTSRKQLQGAKETGRLDPNRIKTHLDDVEDRIAIRNEIAEINKLIDAHDFLKARQKRNDLEKLQGFHLDSDEEANIKGPLRDRIEGSESGAEWAAYNDRIQGLIAQGNENDARKLITQGFREFQSHRPELEALQSMIDQNKAYIAALATLTRLEAGTDTVAKVAAAQAMLPFKREEAKYTAKLHQYQAQAKYEEGKRLQASGDVGGAMQAFQESLALADNQAAKDAITEMKGAVDKDKLVAAGKSSYETGAYAAAAKSFQDAIDQYSDSDGSVAQLLKKAKIADALRIGKEELAKGDTAAAKKAFAAALSVDPDNLAAREGIGKADTLDRYRRLLAAGDELRKAGRFSDATAKFKEAQSVMKTDEVAQRLDDTEYDNLIAHIKSDIAAENWSSAKSWLESSTIKRRERDNDEVKKLRETVDAHTKKPE